MILCASLLNPPNPPEQVAIDLIRAGANVNACNEASGEPLVLMALQKGKQFDYDDLVDTLIKVRTTLRRGALYLTSRNVYWKNRGCRAKVYHPTHPSPTFSSPGQCGANLNGVNKSGFSALHMVAQGGMARVLDRLLATGGIELDQATPFGPRRVALLPACSNSSRVLDVCVMCDVCVCGSEY